MNLRCVIHLDKGDKEKFCLVLVLSDCEGGELAFKELGVVLDLQSGDFVIFRSKDLSHFNLHFRGIRFSFVFHTDSHYQLWRGKESSERSRNGWGNNIHFNSSNFDTSERYKQSVTY